MPARLKRCCARVPSRVSDGQGHSGRVRTRNAHDVAACIEVLTTVHHVDGYPMTWPADPIAWLSPPNTLAAFVAVDEVDVVGHVLLVGDADGPAKVSRLFVAPPRRASGIGDRLLAAAVAASSGLTRLTLEVVEKRHDVTDFYERRGWELIDRRPASWTAPDGSRPSVRHYAYPSR